MRPSYRPERKIRCYPATANIDSHKFFSSCPTTTEIYDDDESPSHHQYNNHQHCETCSCPPSTIVNPKYSFYKRTLPSSLIALSSPEGKSLLVNSIKKQRAECYFPLMEQLMTQSDPSYCGLTTLAMVLNTLQIDPKYFNWKGIWRWYDEEVLINTCCVLNRSFIKEHGITLEEFCILGHCNGADIILKRPSYNEETFNNIESFRKDIKEAVQSTSTFIVTSFNRKILSQTGTGHFSPIAAYDEERDLVLVLDVARFKYTPYWVSVDTLYQAMLSLDDKTSLPRGWFLVKRLDDNDDHCKVLAVSSNSSRILIHSDDATESIQNNKIILPNDDKCRLRCDNKIACSSKLCRV